MPRNTHRPANDAPLADSGTARNACFGSNRRTCSNPHVVSDLYEVINNDIVLYYRVINRSTVNTHICSDANPIANHDSSKLCDTFPSFGCGIGSWGKTEAFHADAGLGMNPHRHRLPRNHEQS